MRQSNVNQKMAACPAWIRDCPRRFMVGFHVPDYDQIPEYPQDAPRILSMFDAREFVGLLKRARVQVFWFYNKCHCGNSYHPSNVPGAHVHSGMGDRDYFGELVEACLVAGIVPCAVYEFADHRVIHDKPEWCHWMPRLDQKGDMTDALQGAQFGLPCLHGPYGEYAIAQAVETIKKYPICGYYIDFLGLFTPKNWRCSHGCMEAVSRAIGAPFQGVDKLNHAQYVQYLKWKYAQYDVYAKRMLGAIQAERSDVVFVHNAHLASDVPNLQTFDLASRNCHFLTGDRFTLRGGTLQMSWVLRAYAGASRCLPAEALLDSCVNIGWDFASPKSLDGYRAETWTARAANVATCCSISMNIDGSVDEAPIKLAGEIFREQSLCEPWLRDILPLGVVGVVRSQNTIDFRPDEETTVTHESVHGLRLQNSLHSLEFKGWVQVLVAAHQLWDVIQDYQLTDSRLGRLRVLILPDVGCLSAEQCAAIVRFVKRGGVLIATGETAMFDENGERSEHSALAKSLGVEIQGYRNSSPVRIMFENPVVKPKTPWIAKYLYCTLGHWHIKSLTNTDILGVIHKKIGERLLVNAYAATTNPGLTCAGLAKGRAYYCAALPGAEYRIWGYGSQQVLIKRLLELAVGRHTPIALEAPETVELFAHYQTGHKRLVINLVNNVSGVSRSDGQLSAKLDSLPGGECLRFDDVAAMPPVAHARLYLRESKIGRIQKVYSVPDRNILQTKPTAIGLMVDVGEFDVHKMVVVDYE